MEYSLRIHTGRHGGNSGLTGLLLAGLLLCACGGGDGGGEKAVTTAASASSISGAAQKGPYRSDTPVTIYQLDSLGNRTENRVTAFVNASGNFAAQLPWRGPGEAEITGDYYDELNAVYSGDTQRLSVLFEADSLVRVNINVFTHLASARMRRLIANGQSFSAAIEQASNEIKNTFQLQLTTPAQLMRLDVTKGDGADARDNANLLLFSTALLGTNIANQTLSLIETDFSDDGQINTSGLNSWIRLCAVATTFSLDSVSLNVENLAWVQNAPDFSDLDNTYPLWIGVGNDRDTDGLDDHEEILTYFSDPLSIDTDNDGIHDRWETLNGLDLLTNDAALDPDNDGLHNLNEFLNLTNPQLADTDSDSYSDSEEIAQGGDPLDADSLPLAFTSAPGLTVDATRDYSYPASTTWNGATYTLADGPAGMSIDPSTGLLSWTPGVEQTGIYNVVIEVSDQLYVASQSFTVNVAAFNTGDINEDNTVDARDWLLAQRIALGLMTPTTDQFNRSDIKLDGQVSGADILLIERLALGL